MGAPEKTAQDQTQPPQEVLQDQNQSRGQGQDQNQSHGQGRGQNQGRNRDQNQGRNQDQSHDQNHDQDRGHKVVLDKVVQDEVDQVHQMQEGRGQDLDRNQEVDHV